MNLYFVLIALVFFILIFIFIYEKPLYEGLFVGRARYSNIKDEYIIETKEEFLEMAKIVQDEIDIHFPGTKIISYQLDYDWENKTPSSKYFRYVSNKDLFDYKKDKMYTWDQETLDLYKEFYKSKGYNLSDQDYDLYTTKLRKIYTQSMITELLTRETEFGNIYKDGLLFEWDLEKMTNNFVKAYNKGDPIKNNQWTINCNPINSFTKPVFGDKSIDPNNPPDNIKNLFKTTRPLMFKDGCEPCTKKNKCGKDMEFGSSIDKKIWKKSYMMYNPE